MQRTLTTNRRRFIQSSLGASLVVGVDSAAPNFLLRAAENSRPGDETILVVVQLSGGNDGLNTVIPFADDAYRERRPTLAIPSSDVLKLTDVAGLHPALRPMADLFEDGLLSIIQGIGYANPNRSHFESMDIWHTCRRKDEPRSHGWLGRFLDGHATGAGGDVPAIHFGHGQQPLALAARDVRVPSVKALDEFKLKSQRQEAFRSLIEELASAPARQTSDLLSFVQSSTSAALVASKRVEEASQDYATSVDYPETELARKLRIVAQLIDSGLATRIYYVELDGFDTHAQQADTHSILLREWGGAVSSFVRDVSDHGHADRVCVMSFSEFGRRVSENASGGTDHGAAAPLFLAGGGLKPGFHGEQPSLTDLEDGDLKYHTDFRQVYASILDDWLGVAPEPILGQDFPPLGIFAAQLSGAASRSG